MDNHTNPVNAHRRKSIPPAPVSLPHNISIGIRTRPYRRHMQFAYGLLLRLVAKREAGSAGGFENTAYDGLSQPKSALSALWPASADTFSVGVY